MTKRAITTIWPIREVVDAAVEVSMDGFGYPISAKDVYEFLWQCHDDIEGLYPQLDGMPREMPDVFEKLYNQKCIIQEPFPYPPGA